MDVGTKDRVGSLYFAALGIIVMAIGAAEMMLGATGGTFEWGIMEMSGDFLMWRGLIMFFAGAFYLSGTKDFTDIHQKGKIVMASVMIWIVGGMGIFAMILESIPGGEDGGWFNTWEGFVATYAPPYMPEILLLPFSLVVIYYTRSLRAAEGRPTRRATGSEG